MKKIRVVLISSMLPSGHYSQFVANGLLEHKNIELIVYADKNENNLHIKNCGRIELVWTKSIGYIPSILNKLLKDRPDVVHLQHELNMYGGILTAVFFPALVLGMRCFVPCVITTIHSAPFKKCVDKSFVDLFHRNSILMRPFFIKLFFGYLYKFIALFSHGIIVHTHLTKQILMDDYNLTASKIRVIPAGIPQKNIDNTHKRNYFLYFGYMARRKGLEYVLGGYSRYIANHPACDAKIILAGGVIKGQEEAYAEIVEIIKRNSLETKVILRGFIEESEQDELYREAYAILIPAIISMGSSGPLYHSASHGKAVICSKVGHFLEDIEDGKTGILVNNDNWESAFDIAIKYPNLISRIESNVEVKARLRSPYATTKKYIEMYAEVLSCNLNSSSF